MSDRKCYAPADRSNARDSHVRGHAARTTLQPTTIADPVDGQLAVSPCQPAKAMTVGGGEEYGT